MSISILLADDHTLFRESLRNMIDKQAEMEVLGEAKNVSAGRLAQKVGV